MARLAGLNRPTLMEKAWMAVLASATGNAEFVPGYVPGNVLPARVKPEWAFQSLAETFHHTLTL
ncbi:MAG: hypothetical protein R3F41_08700 [Gammaproteobacteria bacterium]|nr:hypothetical protein [Pseudomonadales bacterium]MCP5346988.1 hypothetical protein [Pseudomonadales bacterium]